VKTLIVEDSATLCEIYARYLDGSGLDVSSVQTLSAAQQQLSHSAPQLILLDIELPDGNGLDLLEDVKRLSPQPAVVVMTGHGAEYAEQAMRRGATDFLSKPFDASRLRVTLLNAADKLKLRRQVEQLSVKRETLGPLVGQSSAMQAVFDTVELLSGTRATAFLMGESGTGKELAARAIHQLSARAPASFVVVDCAALTADQLERALFGKSDAAPDGLVAQADAGTLFLDEVCSLNFEAQSMLLRLIQHGTYRPVDATREVTADVRIIASTNRDPLFEMREGRLREDLYYRLHVVPLRMPPLRERADDIVLLAERFLLRISEEEGKAQSALSNEATNALRHYSWPGNVRQLENAIRQLVLTESAHHIDEASVYRMISGTEIAVDTDGLSDAASIDYRASDEPGIQPLWLTEKIAIEAAIAECDGSINRAAKCLQVAPSTIYRKIQSWKAPS
jgi:two-component system, repressor protein LuxO